MIMTKLKEIPIQIKVHLKHYMTLGMVKRNTKHLTQTHTIRKCTEIYQYQPKSRIYSNTLTSNLIDYTRRGKYACLGINHKILYWKPN